MTETRHHRAAGAVLGSGTERFGEVTDPASGVVTRRVVLATAVVESSERGAAAVEIA